MTPTPRIPPGKAPVGQIDFAPVLGSIPSEITPDNSFVEVLLLGPGAGTRALFAQVFENSNWRLENVSSVPTAVSKLRQNPMAVVIYEDSDAPRPSSIPGWLELLAETRTLDHPPKVIVASRQADDRLWADVLHQGGYDVLPMPLECSEVLRTVSMAWLEWRREGEARPVRAMAMGAAR